ncbi:hypothetical protein MARPO_0129s0045 [Marchantia polymorpha]|uniref:Uncharacterized protein n=1 Tax=Marchantia polymorpha TaxID=3197 RepID=A0A2R6W8H0_MARPO|nr:hypothetical protein MARPO_0129s0045 [Marchantia polymorpha]|eukprot:PTQ30160.1 hypothetical protein MARPO_0129s0045 [Marchantia polymorpha]
MAELYLSSSYLRSPKDDEERLMIEMNDSNASQRNCVSLARIRESQGCSHLETSPCAVMSHLDYSPSVLDTKEFVPSQSVEIWLWKQNEIHGQPEFGRILTIRATSETAARRHRHRHCASQPRFGTRKKKKKGCRIHLERSRCCRDGRWNRFQAATSSRSAKTQAMARRSDDNRRPSSHTDSRGIGRRRRRDQAQRALGDDGIRLRNRPRASDSMEMAVHVRSSLIEREICPRHRAEEEEPREPKPEPEPEPERDREQAQAQLQVQDGEEEDGAGGGPKRRRRRRRRRRAEAQSVVQRWRREGGERGGGDESVPIEGVLLGGVDRRRIEDISADQSGEHHIAHARQSQQFPQQHPQEARGRGRESAHSPLAQRRAARARRSRLQHRPLAPQIPRRRHGRQPRARLRCPIPPAPHSQWPPRRPQSPLPTRSRRLPHQSLAIARDNRSALGRELVLDDDNDDATIARGRDGVRIRGGEAATRAERAAGRVQRGDESIGAIGEGRGVEGCDDPIAGREAGREQHAPARHGAGRGLEAQHLLGQAQRGVPAHVPGGGAEPSAVQDAGAAAAPEPHGSRGGALRRGARRLRAHGRFPIAHGPEPRGFGPHCPRLAIAAARPCQRQHPHRRVRRDGPCPRRAPLSCLLQPLRLPVQSTSADSSRQPHQLLDLI